MRSSAPSTRQLQALLWEPLFLRPLPRATSPPSVPDAAGCVLRSVVLHRLGPGQPLHPRAQERPLPASAAGGPVCAVGGAGQGAASPQRARPSARSAPGAKRAAAFRSVWGAASHRPPGPDPPWEGGGHEGAKAGSHPQRPQDLVGNALRSSGLAGRRQKERAGWWMGCLSPVSPSVRLSVRQRKGKPCVACAWERARGRRLCGRRGAGQLPTSKGPGRATLSHAFRWGGSTGTRNTHARGHRSQQSRGSAPPPGPARGGVRGAGLSSAGLLGPCCGAAGRSPAAALGAVTALLEDPVRGRHQQPNRTGSRVVTRACVWRDVLCATKDDFGGARAAGGSPAAPPCRSAPAGPRAASTLSSRSKGKSQFCTENCPYHDHTFYFKTAYLSCYDTFLIFQ